MNFKKYEDDAKKTDQFPENPDRSLHDAINNLLTEVVNLNRLYLETSKFEGARAKGREKLTRKVGDILWYLTNFSRLSGFSLEKAAENNLKFVKENYELESKATSKALERENQLENLPNKIDVAFVGDGHFLIIATELGNHEYLQLGDRINDNSDTIDFYRYHDVFHLAYVAILNWSPVMRSLFKRKRKSDPLIDERQDGARAGDLEEAITAYVFEHARISNWFSAETATVSFEVLNTIKLLTAHLEVHKRTFEQWEKAILEGYKMFNLLKKNKGGVISINRELKTITFQKKKRANKKLQAIFKHYADGSKRGSTETDVAKFGQRAIERASEKLRPRSAKRALKKAA